MKPVIRLFAARPAADLLRAWAVLGYVDGAPAHLAADCKTIDAQLCRALLCPGCRKRGMDYHPMHRSRQYAALAICSRCGAGEEI